MGDGPMTSKERVHAALEGRPVDRFPVAAPYCPLNFDDHFAEATGEPDWRWHAWVNAPDDEAYLRCFRRCVEAMPFEMLQPHAWSQPREWRRRQEYLLHDGRPCRHDRQTDEWQPLPLPNRSVHRHEYTVVERRTVFDRADADAQMTTAPAEAAIAEGRLDFVRAVVAEYGGTEFVLSGGMDGCFWACQPYVGPMGLLTMAIEEPRLLDYMVAKALEQRVESVRFLAAAGGDGIYVDDAFATSEMISLKHYERFCVPTTRALVEEIHRHGHKAILIYYGGVMDRLEQIASLGADGLVVEASMKGYHNDIEAIVDAVGDRLTLFANIHPVEVIQGASDEMLRAEVARQATAGRRARGFILGPAHPITPGTGISRIQAFISTCRELGRSASQT